MERLRVLNWNIGHGGGPRLSAICRHIEEVGPDLLALTEFQTRNEPSLRAQLDRLGYPFVVTSNPIANRNGLLVACRRQLEHAPDGHAPDIDRERWLTVRLSELDLDILVLHIPGTPDNKFENGYGISGAKRKELFWERAINYAAGHQDRRAIIMGDFNTGFRIDAEGANFKKSHYMAKLLDVGFIDTWRRLHANERDYTWFSKRKDKTTGKSQVLNGFRLDYIFVSSALEQAITDAAILHGPRTAGASDHASVVAYINMPQVGVTKNHADGQLSTDLKANEETSNVLCDKASAQSGNVSACFDIVGSLPNMTCGINGQEFLQQFRPAYVTAEWAGRVLKEVRIWGPRVLQDGSLGKRELDHRWTRTIAGGGVKYSELPFAVATQLKSYIDRMS